MASKLSRPRWANVLARIGITLAAIALFFLLRQDWADRYWRRFGAPSLIGHYVRDNQVRRLQIGAGSNTLPGWLNTDIEPREGQVYLDATKRLPVGDGSIHYIFSEQVIEHFTYEQGLAMLRECHRVLAPGGKIRLATPNLLKFADLLADKRTEEILHFVKYKAAAHDLIVTPDPECYILNQLFRDGHQFLYTPRMLRARLGDAGFTAIQEFRPGESDDPELTGIDFRQRTAYKAVDAYETMVLQAVRE